MRAMLGGWALVIGVAGCAATGPDQNERFTSGTVDFGIVVRDLDASAAFYRDGLGLIEVGTFDVPAGFARDTGLTDHKPFHVKRFQTVDSERATNVKLMAFPDTPVRDVDNAYIHTSLGVSYLTLFVADIDAAVARARQAGADPLARGPVALPEGFPQGIYLACVRDPDGNIIELVGPKRSE